MDELAVAQSVLESILAEAGRVKLKPMAATLSYGSMCAMNKEVLRDAFRSLADGSVCAGMSLNIREMPLQIQCNSCGQRDVYEISAPSCPRCRSHDFHFLSDAPIVLEDIDFQEP
jgi:Zn finger protein HypA/HybF involved in hydrogenase expression